MAGKMASRKEGLSAVEMVRLLGVLFHPQHPECRAWAASQGASGPSQAPAAHSDDERRKRPIPPRPPGPGAARSERPAAKAAPQPPQPRPPRPSPPSFAREISGSLDDWRDRQRGIEIGWDQEESHRKKFAAAAGLSKWSNGYSATMLTVSGTLPLGPELKISVEIVIPRVQQLDLLLVGVGRKDMPKRFFEMPASELSPDRVRQIAAYAADLGARG